ncbi:MAG: 30S ribosomal protein S6 [Nitrospira sp.]|nr:30S ribosomal protein S6 [Nitrospira sp.]
MNFYESIFIARPSLLDEEIAKINEKVKGIIEQAGGTVQKIENWGKKKLAYEVQKEKKGTYVFLFFQSDGKIISELERAYRLDDGIMKFLTVKLDKKDLAQREWAKKKKESQPEEQEKIQERVSEEIKEVQEA